jgi:ribosome biogenesis GTPase / thiamine phosphate phosphatase
VRVGDESLDCRIKGKVLGGSEGRYNPLAPGDLVEVEPDPLSPGKGLVVETLPRRNEFSRWNEKGKSRQTLAANVDQVVCVASFASPPFRPRFVDRVSVIAESLELPLVVLVNKEDLGASRDAGERLEDFERIGIRVLRCSAKAGTGLEVFLGAIRGKRSVLVGQSGAGKSSLLNAIVPGLSLRVGEISAKWERGAHTTNYSLLIEAGASTGETQIVDTPGVRRLALRGIPPEKLAYMFVEFAGPACACGFGERCTHTHEPGCRVIEAVESGSIHEDRYESYLRIREELLDTFAYRRKKGKPYFDGEEEE